MTVQSNLDAAIVDLKVELDGMDFLDPGAKTEVDQELIDAIQEGMDALIDSYAAVFGIEWPSHPDVELSATMLAHWLFDGQEHQLSMTLSPSNADKSVFFRTPVPLPWRS